MLRFLPALSARRLVRRGARALGPAGLALATAACAVDGATSAERAAQAQRLAREGLALAVDACVYRQNPPLVSNAFLVRESDAAADAMLANLGARLAQRGIAGAPRLRPFLCGSLADDPPSRPKLAAQLGATPRAAGDFPPYRLPGGDRELQAAWQALMALASERLVEPRPTRPQRRLPLAQRKRLMQALGHAQLLLVFARGASISGGLAATDVVVGVLLGGGGCRLGEDGCDLLSTTHEGMRADALLIALDRDDEPRLARPVDIGARGALRGDLDPLPLPPYAETAWADALLDSLDLPAAGAPR